MKRATLVIGLLACAASPAAAQLAGMPVWNSPKGGTGITISGDYGKPNDAAGGGSAFGARGSLGLGNLTLTAGLASLDSDSLADKATSYGITGAFRVIGGSLLPVAINLQAGAGQFSLSGTSFTTVLAGAGVSASVPTPGISIEPYLSVTNRWHKIEGLSGTESNIGFTVGANVGFGMLGAHIAFDSEKDDSGATNSIIGIGLHVALKAPIGM